MEWIKNHVTVICLTVITIVETIMSYTPFFSFFLWVGYGMYKSD